MNDLAEMIASHSIVVAVVVSYICACVIYVVVSYICDSACDNEELLPRTEAAADVDVDELRRADEANDEFCSK